MWLLEYLYGMLNPYICGGSFQAGWTPHAQGTRLKKHPRALGQLPRLYIPVDQRLSVLSFTVAMNCDHRILKPRVSSNFVTPELFSTDCSPILHLVEEVLEFSDSPRPRSEVNKPRTAVSWRSVHQDEI